MGTPRAGRLDTRPRPRGRTHAHTQAYHTCPSTSGRARQIVSATGAPLIAIIASPRLSGSAGRITFPRASTWSTRRSTGPRWAVGRHLPQPSVRRPARAHPTLPPGTSARQHQRRLGERLRRASHRPARARPTIGSARQPVSAAPPPSSPERGAHPSANSAQPRARTSLTARACDHTCYAPRAHAAEVSSCHRAVTSSPHVDCGGVGVRVVAPTDFFRNWAGELRIVRLRLAARQVSASTRCGWRSNGQRARHARTRCAKIVRAGGGELCAPAAVAGLQRARRERRIRRAPHASAGAALRAYHPCVSARHTATVATDAPASYLLRDSEGSESARQRAREREKEPRRPPARALQPATDRGSPRQPWRRRLAASSRSARPRRWHALSARSPLAPTPPRKSTRPPHRKWS